MSEKNKKFTFQSISIRTRLLVLLISISALAVVSSIGITILIARQTGFNAESVSSELIRSQLINSLEQLNQHASRENDQTLANIARNAQFVAQYLSDVYTGGQASSSTVTFDPQKQLFIGKEGQHLNSKDETSSVFVPNFQQVDTFTLEDIKKSAYLDLILKPVFDNNPNIEAIYFSSPRNVVRYYPNIDLGNVVPPDFTATERPWYKGAIANSTSPEKAYWTPVYLDATGLGAITTAAIPVYGKNKEILGVVGFDVTITDMVKNIEKSMVLESGYNFLVDSEGNAIALPEQGYQDILGRSPEAGEFGTNLLDSSTGFKSIINEMVEGKSGIRELDIQGRQLIVAYSPLENTGWSLGSVVDAQQVLSPISELKKTINNNIQSIIFSVIIPISLLVLVAVIILGLILTNLFTAPIRKLAIAAEKLGQGNWTVEIPQSAPGEIGTFATIFQQMASQIREMITTLEEKVAMRTSDLKRRAVQLQAAIEVGHAVASEHDLDHLLSIVTHLISERFGFYHVGVFLVDSKGEYAWLRAANSEGGQRMLARNHRLKVGEQGIVGFVTGTAQPRIALNVGQDAVFFNNPDLPATKSEMALPLIAGGKVLGALDIQSEIEGAFTDEDITVLGGMADLIAVAIQNAQLFADYERAMETTRRAYGEKSAKAWSDMTKSQTPWGYLSTKFSRLIRVDNTDSNLVEAVRTTHTYQIQDADLICPILVKGNLLGALRLKKNASAKEWSSQEALMFQSIANRIGTALEAARLYEESQRRADRERFVGEIGTKLRSSNQPQEILQIAIQELRQALNASQAQVEFQISNSGNSPHQSEVNQ